MASGAANLIALETSLAQQNIRFKEMEEADNPTLRVRYSMQNMDRLDVYFAFDEDGETLHFATSVIARVPESKLASGAKSVNSANMHYRWLTFYIDNDNDIIANGDAFLIPDLVGETCTFLLDRILSICDDAYAGFMRDIWAS